MQKFKLFLTLLICFLPIFIAANSHAATPNIVIMVTDDEPYLDGRMINFMPNAKSIFKDHGLSFTDFRSSSPLCCPARAGILTGQHTHNHGVVKNEAKIFNPAETIATELNNLGYYTGLYGKYFNGYGAIAPQVPPGWDKFSAVGQPAYYDYKVFNDGNPTPELHGFAENDYSTDVFSIKAVNFINNAPSNQPIFLYVAPFSTHLPNAPAERWKGNDIQCPKVKFDWAPANYNEADVSDKPKYVRDTPLLTKSKENLNKHCLTLQATDEMIGDIKSALVNKNRWNNILFIYIGDNGMNIGAHRLSSKYSPYITEVPFYFYWSQLGQNSRTVNAELVYNIDIAPTLCEITGCTMGPYPNGQSTADGKSFLPILNGGNSTNRSVVLEEMPDSSGSLDNPPWSGVRTTTYYTLGKWHYVEYTTGEKELYNLSGGNCWDWQIGESGDPCELNNLAGNSNYFPIKNALAAELALLKLQRGN